MDGTIQGVEKRKSKVEDIQKNNKKKKIHQSRRSLLNSQLAISSSSLSPGSADWFAYFNWDRVFAEYKCESMCDRWMKAEEAARECLEEFLLPSAPVVLLNNHKLPRLSTCLSNANQDGECRIATRRAFRISPAENLLRSRSSIFSLTTIMWRSYETEKSISDLSAPDECSD